MRLKFQSSIIQFLLCIGALLRVNGEVSAQTATKTITPDPNFALHVKTNDPAQDVLLLEGLRASTTETNVVVSDANGRLRDRPIDDLVTGDGEWRHRVAQAKIYANRAKIGVANAHVVISDSGLLGMGTTTPVAGVHLYNRGMITGAAPTATPQLYDTREQLRVMSATDDTLIVAQDGTGNLDIKWNSTYGSAERFLNWGGYASRKLLHGNPAAGGLLFNVMQSAATGVAGRGITWTSRFQITNDSVVSANANTVASGQPDATIGGRHLDTTIHYGFMAQGLARAFPHTVTEADGYLQVEHRELTGILFAATHELRAEALDAKARIAQLEIEIRELRTANLELARDVHSLSAEMAELKKNMTTVLQHHEAGTRIQASEH